MLDVPPAARVLPGSFSQFWESSWLVPCAGRVSNACPARAAAGGERLCVGNPLQEAALGITVPQEGVCNPDLRGLESQRWLLSPFGSVGAMIVAAVMAVRVQ